MLEHRTVQYRETEKVLITELSLEPEIRFFIETSSAFFLNIIRMIQLLSKS